MDPFDAIRQGIDPDSGEFLRPRQSADRFNGEGEKMREAHNEAVREVAREIF